MSNARSRGGTSCCRRCSTDGASISATWKAARAAEVVLKDGLRSRRAARPVLQGAGAAGAGRAVRLAARLSGRPPRLLDDRHADAAGCGSGGRRFAEGARQAPAGAGASRRRRRKHGRAACRRTGGPLQAALVALDPATGHVRAMVGGRDFRREPFQSRGAGAPPAGLGVQAVRLRGRARGRLSRRRRIIDHLERSDRDAAGRVDAGRRTFERRRR